MKLTRAIFLSFLASFAFVASGAVPPGWGQFRKCQGSVLRVMPAADAPSRLDTAVFTLTQKDRHGDHTFDAHLTVSDDVVFFAPERRAKRKASFVDLRVGMHVIVSGIVSTNGSPATEILILDTSPK